MDRELLLLGLLRRGDMHGYKLHEFINRDMAFCTDLKKPTAYHLLQKMAASGWILEIEEQEGNRPPRKVYKVTDEGEAVFQRLLRENLREYYPSRFTGDIGIAFVDALPPDEARTLLLQRRAALETELETVNAAHSAHTGVGIQFVVEHQIFHLQAEIDWLDKVIAHLGGQS